MLVCLGRERERERKRERHHHNTRNKGNNNMGDENNNNADDDYNMDGDDDWSGDDWYGSDDTFNNYQPTTRDPGHWMMVAMLTASLFFMCVLMPLAVYIHKWGHQQDKIEERRKRRILASIDPNNKSNKKGAVTLPPFLRNIGRKKRSDGPDKASQAEDATAETSTEARQAYTMLSDKPALSTADSSSVAAASPVVGSKAASADTDENSIHFISDAPMSVKNPNYRPSTATIFACDTETMRILRYAAPFTISSIISAISNGCIVAFLGHYVGTKEMAAYAVVLILVEIVDELVEGPISALTAVCAHAVGAKNYFLAGQYVQMAIIMCLLLQAPLVYVWFQYTDDLLLFLGWGDEQIAQHALIYIRVAIWGGLMDTVQTAFLYLFDVCDIEIYTVIIGIIHDVSNVAALLALQFLNSDVELNLTTVAYVHVAISFVFMLLTPGIAWRAGWLEPYRKGIFGSFSLANGAAVGNMIKTAVPLALGGAVQHAEWALLTTFAAELGPAEVAGWAVLGSIWEIFESANEGIGGAAEIRVARHLGKNRPDKAKISSYKSLLMGMVFAVIITISLFCVMEWIPEFFTVDETLQEIIEPCLPIMLAGNVIYTFGLLCWYMVGAQGQFKLATSILSLCSFGLTIPLSALFVYKFQFDLQALSAAVMVGYAGVGASLSFVLLTTDWVQRAEKIGARNNETEESKDNESPELT